MRKKPTHIDNRLPQLQFLPQDKKIALPSITYDELLLPINTIIYAQANGNYLNLFYYDEKRNVTQITVCKLLKHIEKILSPYGIVRVHHSYIINHVHATSINFHSHYITTGNKTSIPYSAAYSQLIHQLFLHTHLPVV